MEASKNTSEKAMGTGKPAGSQETRDLLGVRVRFDRLLLVLGLMLLAVYVAARIHGAVLSRAAVQRFEELKHAAPSNNLLDKTASTAPSTGEPRTTSQSEFVSWSKERIKGFQSSLDQHFADPLAILRVPKIRLEVPMLEGTDDLTLNRGVGRIQGTARLGEDGNIGIAGHRDGFFRGLKALKVGDTIELEGSVRTDTYVVDQLQIVKPTDVSVLQPRSRSSITLVTCYPFYFIGSAPQRYIVHATRTDSEPQKNNTTEQGSLTPQTNKQENTQ